MNAVIQLRRPKSEKPTVSGGRNEVYRKREYLTEAEIEKLLDAAGKSRNPIRDRLLILLAFRHALRVSELVDVRVEQIDLKAGTIHIRRAKNGTPGIHGLQGDELRLIRALDELLRAIDGERCLALGEEQERAVRVLAQQRLGETAGFTFPHPCAHAQAFRGLRTGGPRRRYADPTGLHGSQVDREHGHLHGRGRQAHSQHLGEIAMDQSLVGQASAAAARGD